MIFLDVSCVFTVNLLSKRICVDVFVVSKIGAEKSNGSTYKSCGVSYLWSGSYTFLQHVDIFRRQCSKWTGFPRSWQWIVLRNNCLYSIVTVICVLGDSSDRFSRRPWTKCLMGHRQDLQWVTFRATGAIAQFPFFSHHISSKSDWSGFGNSNLSQKSRKNNQVNTFHNNLEEILTIERILLRPSFNLPFYSQTFGHTYSHGGIMEPKAHITISGLVV